MKSAATTNKKTASKASAEHPAGKKTIVFNTPPVLQQKNGIDFPIQKNTSGAGERILEIVAQLVNLGTQAVMISGKVPGISQLNEKLNQLRTIATGGDEQVKVATLAALEKEISSTNKSAPTGTEVEPIQMTGLEIVAAVVGIGALALMLYQCVAGNAQAQVPVIAPGPFVAIPILPPPPPPPVAAAATLTLQGIIHDHVGSDASVLSEAVMTNNTQRVRYEISWDATVAPGGNHLGQVNGVASNGFVEDLSPAGQSIGDRAGNMGGYFANADFSGPDNTGLYFRFPDHIVQRALNNGSWRFRLSVEDADGTVRAQDIVVVDWTH